VASEKSTKARGEGNFTPEEKAAMKERSAEARRAKSAKGAEADAQACADKIAAMAPADRAIAEKIHTLVTDAAPELAPKTWYGMPAYAKDGKVVCFFQDAAKFKSRYCTLGFQDPAVLDDGTFWPTSYAVTAIGPEEEKTITALVKKAVG
jgi:uncharacterized protein YdhG (YjbR/CyaY superfamily)